MAADRACGQRTIRRQLPLIWLCLSSAMLLLLVGQSQSLTTISSSLPGLDALDEASSTTESLSTTTTTTTTSAMEGETSLAPSTERTSNAIPEAEQSTSELKKYNTKKLDKDSASQTDQMDKPYPYLKKATLDKEDKENAIRQAKRSGDSLALNGTLELSISPKAPSGAASTTQETSSATTTATSVGSTAAATPTLAVEPELASMTPALTTTVSDDETSTPTTLRFTESTPAADKSSAAGETETESVTQTSLSTQSMPSTLSSLPSTTLSAATTGQSEATASVSAAAETNPPSTIITESPPATSSREESSTTPFEQDRSTITTFAVTVTPETITTTEPTVLTVSTRIAAATTLASPPPPTTLTTTPAATTTTTTTTPASTTTTTTSTSTTTTTTTTAKPSTTLVSPKNTATTTMTSEAFSAITTWQDETTPESTTEPFIPTPSPEDVTLLVRIVLEGSWQDVCSKLPILRQSLTDLLNNSIEKPISTRQIIFHQTQCSQNLTPTSLVTDSQLTTLLVYVVDESGSFDGKLTKFLPSLYEASPIHFPLKIHSVTMVPEADSGNAIAVVIVSCVAFICLILLAGLLFIMRKRQGRFNYGERCRPVSLDAYSLDSVSAYNSVRRSKAVVRSSKRSYGNPAFEDSSVTPTHPLNFAGIATFCNDTNAVTEEFASIPQIHSKIEELPPGAEVKNRYANVIPLPETRVPLQRINNDPLSEYINASYVRGPKNATKYYIACQAPTEATVADFWRMIWEQQCKVIIMLTDLVENGVDKCTEYIPPLEVSDCHRLYGDYQVTLKKREAKEKYAISTLHLKNLENNTFREVSHIWYLWPASGVPTDAAGLIAVLLEARALQRGAAGPILVHCSPGTGRTGTLIALDLCIRQYEVTRTVDVPRVVYTIRRDRAGAVQTREQYLFIYKGLNLYASKLAGGGIDST